MQEFAFIYEAQFSDVPVYLHPIWGPPERVVTMAHSEAEARANLLEYQNINPDSIRLVKTLPVVD